VTSKPTTVSGFGITDFISSNSGSPTAQNSATTNGIYYVNNVSLFGQTDGALFVQAYSPSWVGQIYQDYRTGQLALRGENNGSWQGWRAVLDSSNYNSYAPTLTGGNASGTWGISISGNAVTAGGLAVASGTNNQANQIVRTDGNGYIQAGYLNSGAGNENNGSSPANVWGTNGSDSYLRTYQTGSLSVGYSGNSGAVGGVGIGSIIYGTAGYKVGDLGTAAISPQCGCGFWQSSGNADGPTGTWAHYLIVNHSNSVPGNGYQMIISQPYWEDNLYTRRVTADTKESWRKILDSGNYTGYAPSLTGGNASGTWGINVTGSAGSVNGYTMNQNLTTGNDPTFDSVYTGNWFRSNGNSGWYNQSWAVGVYATQAGRVDLYNGAGLYVPGALIATNTGNQVYAVYAP
jgi:hypothetical protein